MATQDSQNGDSTKSTIETPKKSWQDIASRKQAELLASMPAEWLVPSGLLPPETQDDVTVWAENSGWFTPGELAIQNSTASELLPKLASGELSSVAVTKAFGKRAVAAHQLVLQTNCLSETCFPRALSTAAALDAHLASTGKPIGPLHGLPISLKDNFFLAGLDATVGFTSLAHQPSPHDATLAVLLRRAGAVFYVKTNVPTAMMIAETVNNLQGRTLSPLSRRLTPGGSSGGEAALLAFRGSPLGVGTDIGGSLRIPAACTGLFTLRPSFGRFPTLRCRSGMAGQEAVQSVNGPMARALPDLRLYCAAVCAQRPWREDPRCVPIPWRGGKEVELPARLKLGVMWHDGMVVPTPPVGRALKVVVEKLRASGAFEVVEWSPQDQAEGAGLLQRMFVADGGESIRRALAATREPLRPEMAAFGTAAELGTYDMWQLQAQRTEFQKRYLDRWNDAGLDALLCPTTPFSGVENGKFRHVGYTGAFNVLDLSCVSFPTGLMANKELDVPLGDGHTPLSSECAAVHKEYVPEAVDGMAISLQLVARRMEEEKVLAMTQKVLDLLA